MKPYATIALAAMALTAIPACKSAKEAAAPAEQPQAIVATQRPLGGAPAQALPKAVIYKTNGDYNNNVAVNINAAGQLISYPAPTDVSAQSAPVAVGDGWLLDRRGGAGPNTVFLDYTYAQYAQLPQAPTPAQIKAHIIPGAKVTESKQLPIYQYQALADPASVRQYINE